MIFIAYITDKSCIRRLFANMLKSQFESMVDPEGGEDRGFETRSPLEK